jgi:hypothetical protein
MGTEGKEVRNRLEKTNRKTKSSTKGGYDEKENMDLYNSNIGVSYVCVGLISRQ